MNGSRTTRLSDDWLRPGWRSAGRLCASRLGTPIHGPLPYGHSAGKIGHVQCPLTVASQKSHFGAVRAVVDPERSHAENRSCSNCAKEGNKSCYVSNCF
jgi:hypothetical protein